jgi:hypothetical protein
MAKRVVDMSNGEKVRYYKEKLDHRIKSENLLKRYKEALEREKSLSAHRKVKRVFSFPFKGGAFAALWDAILFLGATLIFASCGFFVLWAIIFCALVDFIYMVAFGLGYPFILAYFVIFKNARIKALEKKINKTRKHLSSIMKKEEIKTKLSDAEKALNSSQYSYTVSSYSSTSGIESTEYYKAKTDEYFRAYMGQPPKDDNSLSSLSTDTTLDMHPGDY